MVRGEIWWADLPDPKNPESAKHRPVLVIQGDGFNESKINTVICAVITSNTELADLPGNLLLKKSISGLNKKCVVNFSQITTIEKKDLTKQAAMLPKSILEKVNNCLKLVLDI